MPSVARLIESLPASHEFCNTVAKDRPEEFSIERIDSYLSQEVNR